MKMNLVANIQLLILARNVCLEKLHPHHRLGITTPDLSAVPIYWPPKGWIAWLPKADCMHITFPHGYYTIESKGTGKKWTQIVAPKTNSIPVNQLRRT